MKKLVLFTAMLAFVATPAMANATFGDGGASLQAVLDSHTAPYPGVSSVNVLTDNIANDSYWAIQSSGGSVTTLVFNLSAAFAPSNTFGVYDRTDPTKMVEIFAGGASVGTQDTLSILADGSVRINGVDTGIDFAGNAFGYYLDSSQYDARGLMDSSQPDYAGGLWYSDTTLNEDLMDHMYAYAGKGDTFQIAPYAAGKWSSFEYILAFEDLTQSVSDRNYSDMVVMVESVNPVVPAPGAILLAGIGTSLVGWMRRRRSF